MTYVVTVRFVQKCHGEIEVVNEDYLLVADTLGINRSTARSIVSRYLRESRIAERPRGGPSHVRVDNKMRDSMK